MYSHAAFLSRSKRIIILYSVWDPGPRTGSGYGSGPNDANCYIQECDEFHSFGRLALTQSSRQCVNFRYFANNDVIAFGRHGAIFGEDD